MLLCPEDVAFPSRPMASHAEIQATLRPGAGRNQEGEGHARVDPVGAMTAHQTAPPDPHPLGQP